MTDDINTPAGPPADLEPLADDADLLAPGDDTEKTAAASDEPREFAGTIPVEEPAPQEEPAQDASGDPPPDMGSDQPPDAALPVSEPAQEAPRPTDQRHPNPSQGGRPL